MSNLSVPPDDHLKEIIHQVTTEANNDLTIIANMAALENRHDMLYRAIEVSFKKLQDRITDLTGLRALVNAGYSLLGNLQAGLPNSVPYFTPTIRGILQLLERHNGLVNLLRQTLNEYDLQDLLNSDGWGMDDVVGKITALQAMEAFIQDANFSQDAVNQEWETRTNDLIDLMEQAIIDLHVLEEDLTNCTRRYETLRAPYVESSRLYYGNDTIGNATLAANMIQQRIECGVTEDPMATLKITTAYISRHVGIFTKYGYNISLYIDQHNARQTEQAQIIQNKVSKSWCWKQIRSLDQFKDFSPRRRWTLVNVMYKVMENETNLDQQLLPYLSLESFAILDTIVRRTRYLLQNSAIYLEDPTANAALVDDTFKANLDDVIQLERNFNLVPQPAFGMKYINFTSPVMNTLLGNIDLSKYNKGTDTLTTILDLKKLGKPRSAVFSGGLSTDGFSTSILFDVPVGTLPPLPLLEWNDFLPWEIPYLNIWGADPGHRDIFVASNGSNPEVYDFGKY